MINWTKNIYKISRNLSLLSARDGSGQEIAPDLAFTQWRDQTIKVRKYRKRVYLIGNGASASMASHIAADLDKNAHVRTEVFFDLSLMTAIANDLNYKEVFAEPLRRRMNKGDMLIAISSSGQSPNILRASQEAKRLGGFVVAISAFSPDNMLRSVGALNFYIPADTYGVAETCHAVILHYWVDQMVEMTAQSKERSVRLKELRNQKIAHMNF